MQSELETQKNNVTIPQLAISVVVHLSIGMFGIVILTHILALCLFALAHSFNSSVTAMQMHWMLTGIHGFPAQAVVGFILGFLLGRRMRCSVMAWIWVIPLAFLCIGFIFLSRNGASIWDHFFGYECSLEAHCFDQIMLTLPLVSSIAYSLGAKVSEYGRTKKFRNE